MSKLNVLITKNLFFFWRITVHHSENSSISCAVMCDMKFSIITPNSTSNVKAGTWAISVLVDAFGSLHCSAKQMFDGYSTVNSTHGPSNALSKTTGGCFAVFLFKEFMGLTQRNINTCVFGFTDVPAEPKYLIPAIYGTSAAFTTCLILMALIICYRRQRLRAGKTCTSH